MLIEYQALKSVIIKHLDKVINEYTNDEVIDSIHRANEWAEVEEVVGIQETRRVLKVKFQSTSMAQNAVNNGIIILNQKINGKHIEKGIFVRLTPCYNCYGYEHKTNECPKGKQTLRSYCSEAPHNHTECNKENPKCINCGGSTEHWQPLVKLEKI